MKVKDLIKQLEKESPDADVMLTVGNEDCDIFCSKEFEIHNSQDVGYIELYMDETAPQQL